MKTTRYFRATRTRPDRKLIKDEWIEFVASSPERATLYQYTFTEEVEARKGCAGLWREVKVKKGLTNRYLDDLAAAVEAGFLEEYIWTYLQDSNWRHPESLRLAELIMAEPKPTRPSTRAVARIEEK